MATNNQVNVGLSGSTGTGTFVGATSPTLVTPVLGAASATSLTFSSTSGIIGTTTNDNAAAGSVGEFVSSVITSGSASSLTNATAKNLTSISLTAGDWDVKGNVIFTQTGVVTAMYGWISSTSATLPDNTYSGQSINTTGTSLQTTGFPVPTLRFSLSGTTTIYISGLANFSSGATSFFGGIYARRVR